MSEANLDTLCDLLGDSEDSFDEAIFNIVDNEVAKIDETPAESKAKVQSDEVRPSAACSESSYVSEMERKLQQMQEEMRKMQEQLEAAKSNSTPSAALTQRKLEDVDLFGQPSTSVSRGGNARALRSPVKTNPFEHLDKPRQQAKFHPETPQFGPKVSQKTTRVLSAEEKLKLQQEMRQREKERRMKSLIAGDLADSSDDEKEDPTMETYNDFGKAIKRIAKIQSQEASHSLATEASKPVGFNALQGSEINLSCQSANRKLPKNMIIEKHTKIRIANPTITQISLDLSLMGRKLIPVNRIRNAIIMGETNSDWTLIGINYMKATQKSKNGNTYTMWKMTDLVGDIQTVTVLLFGKANTKHYSMPINKVIGLLNPKILEDRTGKGEVSLSVDHPDKIMEMGDSIDAGKCQAKKADGSNCTNLVNLNACEYCAFHVKKAYKAISSKRAELQSSFSGGGDARSRIMSKIAPKGEIFAGGQILNQPRGLPGKALVKNVRKDHATLASLGVKDPSNFSKPTKVDRLLGDSKLNRLNEDAFFQPDNGKLTFKSHLSQTERNVVRQVAKGVSEELGMKLLAPTPGSRLLMKHLTRETKSEEERVKSRDEVEFERKAKLKEHQMGAQRLLLEAKNTIALKPKLSLPSPQLGRGMARGSDFISLDINDRKKAAAIQALKGKPISKSDPNYVMKRKRSSQETEEALKKVANALNTSSENASEEPQSSSGSPAEKKAKIIRSFTGEIIDEKRMEELRNKKSLNQNLVNVAELEEEEKYFAYHEKKEAMEEKMINTKEIAAKVVTCHLCSYTSYKQSEHCKAQNHLVKRVSAKKRFFECKNCKKRTQSFDKLPKHSCSNCQGSSWIRTGMMRERKGPLLENEKLSIRGREEKFIGSAIKTSDLNINL